jgi:hypothetical protein
MANIGDQWNFNVHEGGESILVAAADASDLIKNRADYECSGSNDDVVINAAIRQMTGASSVTADKTGGKLQLSAGKFVCSLPIVVDRGISLQGIGANMTELAMDTDFGGTSVVGGGTYTIDPANFAGATFQVAGDISPVMTVGKTIRIVDSTSNDGTYTVTSSSFGAINTTITCAGVAFTGEAGQGTVTGPPALIHLIKPTVGTSSRALDAIRHMKLLGDLTNVSDGFGIYADSTNSRVDIRCEDLWIHDIGESGISIGQYWNHRIHQCVCESAGVATKAFVEFRTDPNTGNATSARESIVSECYSQNVELFIKADREGTGDAPDSIHCTNNLIRCIKGIQLTGDNFRCDNNRIWMTCDSTTESSITWNASYAAESQFNASICDNTFIVSGANAATENVRAYIRIICTTFSLQDVVIANNNMMQPDTLGPLAAAIEVTSSSSYPPGYVITGNRICSQKDGISVQRISQALISGNLIECKTSTDDAIIVATSGGSNTIINNKIVSGVVNGVFGSTDIVRNEGSESVTTVTPTLIPFGYSRIAATSNDVAAILPDGCCFGEEKLIRCTAKNNTKTVTVTITNHELGVDEVMIFSENDYARFMWNGEAWATMLTNTDIS